MMVASLMGMSLSACNTTPAKVSCEQMEFGREKDECLHSEIKLMDSTQAQQVLAKAKLIQDPMIAGLLYLHGSVTTTTT